MKWFADWYDSGARSTVNFFEKEQEYFSFMVPTFNNFSGYEFYLLENDLYSSAQYTFCEICSIEW